MPPASVPPASAATIAPITAIPIVPPTCRALFRTADPTPALSTGIRVAAAALGVIVSPIPMPPITNAGNRSQKRASTLSRESITSWAAMIIPRS